MRASGRPEISETAMRRFDELWYLFENRRSQFGGTAFRIQPFQPYFSHKFMKEIDSKDALLGLHNAMARWGKIEQTEARLGKQKFLKVRSGLRIPVPREVDEDHEWSMQMIFFAFYNLCCLSIYGKTIEELVLEVREHKQFLLAPKAVKTAVRRLVSLSKSFLLAEWMQELISKAISNDDHALLETISRALLRDAIGQNYPTANQWLGTLMLWYLGGYKMRPRREFLHLLKQKKIVSAGLEELSFLAMLHKLGITKKLTLTKTHTK